MLYFQKGLADGFAAVQVVVDISQIPSHHHADHFLVAYLVNIHSSHIAAILEYGGHTRELKGGDALTTNNKMELTAAIEALNALKRPCTVELHTDSQYVKNGVQSWMHGWKRNGWKTADKKSVENQDLWKLLLLTMRKHEVSYHKVPAHQDHAENNRCDELAKAEVQKVIKIFADLQPGQGGLPTA